MRVLYALNCEHAEPRDDGRIDVHGIFHQLYAPGFPAKQDQMVLALAIEWDAGEEGRRDFRLDLVDPGDSPSLTISGHTDVAPRQAGESPPQTRLVLPVQDVVFPAAGTYFLQLTVGDEVVRTAPLHLVENPGAT